MRVFNSRRSRIWMYFLQLVLLLSLSAAQENTRFQVVENSPPGSEVGRVHGRSSMNSNYRFTESLCQSYFDIDPTTSLITVKADPLDREMIAQGQSDVVACFISFDVISGTTNRNNIRVFIEVLDLNDNTPSFSDLSEPESFNISENVAIPTPLQRLQPVDRDKGLNGTTTFNITRGNDGGFFEIQVPEGHAAESTNNRVLFLKRRLNFEVNRVFNLTITIRDMGIEPLVYDQHVVIQVLDLDDEPPTFEMTSYMFNVSENHPMNKNFARVRAGSSSSGQVFYNICDNCVKVPANVTRFMGVDVFTGGLFLKVPIDYESLSERTFELTVLASNPSTQETANTLVSVDILNINEAPPHFVCAQRAAAVSFDCHQQDVNNSVLFLTEDVDIISPFLLWLKVSDNDSSDSLRVINRTSLKWYVSEMAPIVVSHHSQGKKTDAILISLNGTLDREQTPEIAITLEVENNVEPSLRRNSTILIRVLDTNDNAPRFSEEEYTAFVSEGSPVGKEILQLAAFDNDIGENARVTYSISHVQETGAGEWFEVSPVDGIISTISSSINYLQVGGSVTINITATDNGTEPLSTSVRVVISILPAATFILNAYQEYTNNDINLLDETTTSVYLELRTTERNGLLVYQQDPGGVAFSIQIQNGSVLARLGNEMRRDTTISVSNDAWHFIHVEKSHNQINSLEVEVADSSDRQLSLLWNSSVQGCVNRSQEELAQLDHRSSLYLGGVNIFTLSNTSLPTTSFVGAIRNFMVGRVHLNLSCPAVEVSTVKGVTRSHNNTCAQIQMTCDSNRTSQCVDYAQEPYCRCLGGFPSQACRSSQGSQSQNSYAPIRFKGNTNVKLTLGYPFFSDLEVQRSRPAGVVGTDGGAGSRRRKRSIGTSNLQVVELDFRLTELSSGVILSSKTDSSLHFINITHNGGRHSTLTYRISDYSGGDLVELALQNLELHNRTLYHLTATTTDVGARVELSGDKLLNHRTEDSVSAITPLVKLPQTELTIGGRVASSYFAGCVSRVAVNGIEIPLRGLLSASTTEGGFQVEDQRGVEEYCDLCDLSDCPTNAACEPNRLGEIKCVCEGDLSLSPDEQVCEPPATTAGTYSTGVVSLALVPTKTPTGYLAGGVAAGVVVIIVVFLIVFITIVHRRRQERKKRSYSITNGHSKSQANPYTPTNPRSRRLSPTSSTNANCTDSHERGSSISTYQEHAEDGDPEMDTPSHRPVARGRRKSCTSIESGIKTDTDRDPSIGQGIPKMDDSGNEVASSDSLHTSESEEIVSSCCNEQLQNRPSISLARMRGTMPNLDQQHPHSSHLPSSPHTPLTPLTPKEKKVMIPLQVPNTHLSQSEYGDDGTDTETSFNTSSGVGGSMQNQGRGSDSENSKISDCSTPRWYKIPDTERESERMPAGYYVYPSSHTDSLHANVPSYPPHIQPPMYKSPPSFTSKHMKQSHTRARSRSMNAAQSPLTKTPRYENYMQSSPGSGMGNGNGRMVHESYRSESNYNNRSYHDRQMSDPKISHDDYNGMLFARQYSDPRIPQNGNYCIPRKHNDSWPVHSRQLSDPRQSSQQTQDSIILTRPSRSMKHMDSPSAYSSERHIGGSPAKQKMHYYTLGRIPDHINYTANQPGRSVSSGDGSHNERPYHTLNSVSLIDPISKWDAQDRMKTAVDHLDLLSGPYRPFEDVSTDPSVVESQLTESMVEQQMFDSQGGGEGTAVMLDPLESRLARLQEDEIDSIFTDSESGRQIMNHFPSADCSSQYTTTVVAGSTSTSGESTPKIQKVFIIPPSQQSFDV